MRGAVITGKSRRLPVAAGLLFLAAVSAWAEGPSGLSIESVSQMSPTSIFLTIAAATLVSEDLAAISAGVLAGQGIIGLPLAVASSGFGIFAGDVLLFLAGRFIGRPVLRLPFVSFFVSEAAIKRSSHWLERRGMAAVFISRFVFGTRMPLYVTAGILHTSFWRFTLFFSLAVAIWTPILVGASYYLGARIVTETITSPTALAGLLLTVAGLFIVIRLIPQLSTWRGRRILLGRIKRRFIWEFWSIRVFYLPVIAKIAALAAKHRSLTVFTSANPGIPGGGFVGESKSAILDLIAASSEADGFTLRHRRFEAGDLEGASAFVGEYPVVIKPDAGERGAGVRVARTPEELAEAVGAAEAAFIVQDFAPGEEVSVFYFRHPERDRGEIFSVTEKRFPTVTGDGVSTLEELILADDRAICLAKSYLDQNADDLDSVPAPGETVRIIEIGTHSRGAIFLDGGRLLSPELESRIDAICRGIEGFHFGRFDIRVGSFEEFSRGNNFRIVELNGVTSESTNIYDPRYSLRDAYRILFRQWEIAFEIGAANRRSGASSSGVRELVSMYLAS